MTDADRSLKFEIDVVGTVEQAWTAVATGPGISSWYVPHTVEEREGGAATARFGDGPEMEVAGRVAAWEPLRRVVFDDGTGEGLVFEWTVEQRDDSSCIVRLVNSGFTNDDEGEFAAQCMSDGWQIFLRNLQLHLEHFSGRFATAALPLATVAGPQGVAFDRLTTALGLVGTPVVGQRLTVDGGDGLRLVGELVDMTPSRLSLLLDEPASGTAFVAAELMGDQVGLSIWLYLYDDEGRAVAKSDGPRWQARLDEIAAT